jgi:hypothetical protein
MKREEDEEQRHDTDRCPPPEPEAEDDELEAFRLDYVRNVWPGPPDEMDEA